MKIVCYNIKCKEKGGLCIIMYISNKDLEILQEIELYLYNINKDTITQLDSNFIAKAKDIKDMYAMELYLKLYSINEKLLQEREKSNKTNWNRIAKKEVK